MPGTYTKAREINFLLESHANVKYFLGRIKYKKRSEAVGRHTELFTMFTLGVLRESRERICREKSYTSYRLI